MRRMKLAALVVLALASFPVASAVADDASLKATVQRQERLAKPEARAFVRAVEAWNGKVNRGARRVRRTARSLAAALAEYRGAVRAETSSTRRGAKAKRALLRALLKIKRSLGTLDTGIAQLQDGKSDEQVMRTLRTAKRQANAGLRALEGAQALL